MKKLEKISRFCERIEQDQLTLIKGGMMTFSYCEFNTCNDDYQDTRMDIYDEDGNYESSTLSIREDCCIQ